jgi:hypothetical protein
MHASSKESTHSGVLASGPGAAQAVHKAERLGRSKSLVSPGNVRLATRLARYSMFSPTISAALMYPVEVPHVVNP